MLVAMDNWTMPSTSVMTLTTSVAAVVTAAEIALLSSSTAQGATASVSSASSASMAMLLGQMQFVAMMGQLSVYLLHLHLYHKWLLHNHPELANYQPQLF